MTLTHMCKGTYCSCIKVWRLKREIGGTSDTVCLWLGVGAQNKRAKGKLLAFGGVLRMWVEFGE
jgi:hypothetical protein